MAVHKLLWLFVAALVALPSIDGEAKKRKFEQRDGKLNIGAERPFDAVNMFGDFGGELRLPNTEENKFKIWWERMIRGEVGKDRFLILCALKGGNWKSMDDIRNYLEFKSQKIYPLKKLRNMLPLMAGTPRLKHASRHRPSQLDTIGEGWLEKNHQAEISGISTEWRIEPSVYPLLYFLLMSCPEDDSCK